MSRRPDRLADCAGCPLADERRACLQPESGTGPAGCPTRGRPETLAEARRLAAAPEARRLLQIAARVESRAYRREPDGRLRPVLTRVEETMLLAAELGMRRIGLAFCRGLAAEAARVAELFEGRGFEVVSAICKLGAHDKSEDGIGPEDRLRPDCFDPACNPIGQALVLAEAGCQLNVVIGLCAGHDILFLQHTKAPTTVLAVKDRVTGHSPLAPIYNLESYRRHLRAAPGSPVAPAAKDDPGGLV